MSDPSEIISGLYIGNDKCALYHGEEFDLVINCTSSLPLQKNTKTIRIAIDDDPFDSVPLYQILRDTDILNDIHNTITNGKRVLVHCQAGAQRSPAVVACYLIVYHKYTPHDAVEFIKSRRKVAFFWTVNLYKALQLTYERVTTETQ